MLYAMPALVRLSATAALSESERPVRLRCGGWLIAMKTIAARPRIATRPIIGRLFCTAGCANMLRTCSRIEPCGLLVPARTGSERFSLMGRAMSLID
jgi:hypothetical protein